jgi:hypothetical protein
VTINIVSPGSGANAPGMADETRARLTASKVPLVVEPDDMVAPILFVVSRATNRVNRFLFDTTTGRTAGTTAEIP